MKRPVLLYCIILLAMHTLQAQFKFRIGKSTDNTFTKGEAAKILYTDPSGAAASSWLIQGYVDAGYTVKFSKRNYTSFTLNTELQRNTVIEKKQDVRQYGFTADHITEWLDNNSVATSRLNTTLSIKHSDDRVKVKESMHYILGFTYYATNNASTASWGAKLLTPDLFAPVGNLLGLVVNHNISAVVMNEQSDYLSMVQGNAGLDAFLFHRFFMDKFGNPRTLFVSANWNGRHAVQDEVHNDMQPLRKAGAGLDVSLLSLVSGLNTTAKEIDNRFIIKYEWISGADPLKGLANQNYRLLTLNLVINI